MRVAIYARVSTERQEKEQTIDSQIEQLEEYAKKNKHIIVQKYIDEGWSGELLARPALDELRDDCSKNLFEAILITCPDRLSRKYVYQEIVIEEIHKSSIEIIFLNRPIADTPEDRMLLGIQGLVAEYEKEKIRERCRRGKLHKAKKGLIVGAMAPYGYKYIKKRDNKDGYYVVMGSEASIVRQIFNLLINDQMSIRSICKYLTKHKIPAPKKGKKWGKSTVRRILGNETYAGTTYYNKYYSVEIENTKNIKYRKNKKAGRRLRPKDQWIAISVPAIIDKKTWRLAQSQLKKNAELSPRNIKYHYLLQGLVFCGNCGSRYTGVPCHGKLYYRCTNRQRCFPFPKECNARSIRASIIESAVWDSISEAIKNPKLLITQIKELRKKDANKGSILQEKMKKTELKISKVKYQEDRILDAYTSNVITLKQLQEQMNKIQKSKEELEKEKKQLLEERNEYASHMVTIKNIKGFCKFIDQRLESFDFQEKQKFLRLLIDKIILEENHVRIRGVIPVPPDMEKGKNKGKVASLTS